MAKLTLYFHYPSPNQYFTGKDVPKEEIVCKKEFWYGCFTSFTTIDKKVNEYMNKDRPQKFVYAAKYYKGAKFNLSKLGNVAKWVKSHDATAIHFKVGEIIRESFFSHSINIYLNNSLPAMLKLPQPLFEPYID